MRRSSQTLRRALLVASIVAFAPVLAFAQTSPIAQYSFDENTWNGTANEVRDSTANAMHGTAVGGVTTANASPAIAGNVGTCRYASMDGVDDYVRIADRNALDLTGAMSFVAWVRHRTSSYKGWEAILAKGDSAYRVHLNGGCNLAGTNPGNPANGVTLGLNGGCGSADLNSLEVPAANTWYHIAATFDGSLMRTYINGVLRNTATYNSAVAANAFDLFIGENSQSRGRYWTGDIDEVKVWAAAVTQAQVQSDMAATHACPGTAPHFVITHDRYGINCSAETVTVSVRDASNNPFPGYSGQVTLNTQTARGNWALVSGAGAFNNGTSNDGIATYQWPLGATTATFSLSYPEGAGVLDIDVYQTNDTAIRDDDTEGTMTFSPSGFTVTSSAIGNPPGAIPAFASPQTAGTNFAIHIAAFGQTPGDAQCGVIESYSGAQALRFWSTYVNPASGSRSVTIDGIAAAVSEGAAAPQNVVFTNGQAVVTAKYKDVGLLQIAMKDTSTGHPDLPNGIRGSTGSIVVRPATFTLSSILRTDNGTANPGATTATGPVFIAAGAAFATSVTARDSEGAATPNYGRETPAESVRLESSMVAPAGGATPVVAAPVGFGTFMNGTASGNDFSWPEVGIANFTPRVRDASYLGAGDVAGTAHGPVGRFVPYDFVLTNNVPVFRTGCTTGSFTYIGQPFTYAVAPIATLTARALGGATTRNYTGTFWKITNSTLSARTYSAGTIALDGTGLPPTTTDPAIVDTGNGTGTLTFSAGTGLALGRTTPIAPLTPQIQLSIAVADADGVVAAVNPHLIGNPGGIAFSNGAQQRYGRLTFRNAAAPELFVLPLPMRTEHYADDTTGFVTNSADSCTSGVTLQFASYAGALNAGETCVVDSGAPGVSGLGCATAGVVGQRFRQPPLAGDFNLNLAPPGAGNSGSVTVRAVVPSWLQFEWDVGAVGNENPVGVATFGVFEGEGQRIYQRERY